MDQDLIADLNYIKAYADELLKPRVPGHIGCAERMTELALRVLVKIRPQTTKKSIK